MALIVPVPYHCYQTMVTDKSLYAETGLFVSTAIF